MSTNNKQVFYFKDFLKDGKTDSECIKDCLKACEGIDKRTVVFDGRDWHIDEAILLKSDTTVIIDNCTIKQNNYVFDNVFRGDNLVIDRDNPYGGPIDVLPLRNIKIIGRNLAKIIGCDVNKREYHPILKEEQDMVGDFWGWRTLQISLSNCNNFEITGIELLQTRGWALSFDFCSEGYIHDLNIVSNVKNGDGVNFRLGCHHCRVENITGYTSDDTVACTALMRSINIKYPFKHYLYPCVPTACCFKKKQREYDIHDISIKGIYTGGQHHGVICLAADGARVYNIEISDVIEEKKGSREATVKIYTGYGDNYSQSDLNNIKVENVRSYISDFSVMCNAKVDKVVLKNISQHNPGKDRFFLKEKEGIEIID